jgi:hypothetical protein
MSFPFNMKILAFPIYNRLPRRMSTSVVATPIVLSSIWISTNAAQNSDSRPMPFLEQLSTTNSQNVNLVVPSLSISTPKSPPSAQRTGWRQPLAALSISPLRTP